MCPSRDKNLNQDDKEGCSMKAKGAFGFTKARLLNTKLGFKARHIPSLPF